MSTGYPPDILVTEYMLLSAQICVKPGKEALPKYRFGIYRREGLFATEATERKENDRRAGDTHRSSARVAKKGSGWGLDFFFALSARIGFGTESGGHANPYK
jgi:hypothetical protein